MLSVRLQDAIDRFSHGDYRACLDISRAALANADSEPAFLYLAARAAHRLGRVDSATAFAKRAVDHAPDFTGARALLARLRATDPPTRTLDPGREVLERVRIALDMADGGQLDVALLDLARHCRGQGTAPRALITLLTALGLVRDRADRATDLARSLADRLAPSPTREQDWYNAAVTLAELAHNRGDPVTSALWSHVGHVSARWTRDTLDRLGNLHIAHRDWHLALACYGRLAELAPDELPILDTLCRIQFEVEAFDPALETARAILARDPRHTGARIMEAKTLYEQGEVRAAAQRYAALLEDEPDHAEALIGHGAVLTYVGRYREALALYDRAGPLPDPDQAVLRLTRDWNRSIAHLHLGRLAEGWDRYDAGFAIGKRLPGREPPVPRWRGEPLAGRHLMVWREQGVGDEIRFAGCYPDLAATLAGGDRVTIETDPRLVGLFARSFPWARVRAETRTARNEETIDPPDFDLAAPVAALCQLYRRDPAAFPDHDGYLAPDPDRVASWRRWLAGLPGRRTIGVSWRSGRMTVNRSRFYLTIEALTPLAAVEDVQLVNLQYGDSRAERMRFRDLTGREIVSPPGLDLRDDFEGTAALMAALDLVIAPETAAGELASAVGAACWRFGPPGTFTTHGLGDRILWAPKSRYWAWRAGKPAMVQAMVADLQGRPSAPP